MLRSEPSTEHQGGVEHRAQTTNEAEGNVIDDNTINSPEHNRDQNNVNNNGDHINNNNNNNNNVVVNGSNGINTQAIRVTVQEQPNDNFLCVNATKNANQAERRLMRDLRSLQKSVSRQQTENADPNPASPANGEAAYMLVDNVGEYNRRIRECVESSLMQEFSESDCSSDDDEEDDKDVCDHLHLHPPPHHHNNGSENNYSGTSNTHTNSNSNGE